MDDLPNSRPTDPRPQDPWKALRAATAARVGLGRSGDAMPLSAVLEFQQAHAMARDAVHAPLDIDALEAALKPLECLRVTSEAAGRAEYLRRPDLGRKLDRESASALDAAETGADVAFVIADGLSATAVQMHAANLVHACMERISGLKVAPVVLASQARVALGDDVGERLGAKLVAVLIGERPGLSVAESLGVYLTFGPKRGRRDHERNCISNVHGKGGLTYAQAADKLAWLATSALRLGLTGVKLKDDVDALAAPPKEALPGGG
ncbi:ethanolamine ammonia-lyase subunit EutC [Chenggangzhangella methanolivorans]|uniref:Ethanolamine ammonia-lyase small subunit n=1 Tax=Chenggangzhangella methanolivorans TaxID=1437009 RepID=A0A9E6RB54_9HYPH|nr:ethanolamine ammonia-lyase subunit EutC [Chenggangzhangella methanolivorans]QZO01526.1 ethanolamine ammonia-lyase subunit EutC [Chenggangzhangella methanolivorans]